MGRVKEWMMDETDKILHQYLEACKDLSKEKEAYDNAFAELTKLVSKEYAREVLNGDPEPRPFEM